MSIRDDTGWSQTTDEASRLAWARRANGYTQETFAEAVGFKRGAYRKYESGETALKFEQAQPWARKLKVRWEWLLDGKQLPWSDGNDARRSRPAAEAADMIDAAEPDEQERVLAVVKAMLRTGT